MTLKSYTWHIRPGRRFATRRFTTAVVVLSMLAVGAYLSHTILDRFQPAVAAASEQQLLHSSTLRLATARLDGTITVLRRQECRQLHSARDKCSHVRKYCADDNSGLIPYLTLYYCDFPHLQPLGFVLLVAWSATLFSTIGIAASDFFSINLSTISRILGLSENLAGVTFLAFGNGSPDVFSTFAAMGSNSTSMAIGELVGAAGFITAVVAGSMALVREFEVSRKTFVRDVCFFLGAAAFVFTLIVDGDLKVWECTAMIAFYVTYVVFVVGWHWYSSRRARRRQQEAASRSFIGVADPEVEPYRDYADQTAGVGNQAGPSTVGEQQPQGENDANRYESVGDVRTIDLNEAVVDQDRDVERVPEIHVHEDEADDDTTLEDKKLHVAAEVASSMRVLRHHGKRSNTTISPIRPSLVGALEFRFVLHSLLKERNGNMAVGEGPQRSWSAHQIHTFRTLNLHGRERAMSSSNAPSGHERNVLSKALHTSSQLAPLPLLLEEAVDQAQSQASSPDPWVSHDRLVPASAPSQTSLFNGTLPQVRRSESTMVLNAESIDDTSSLVVPFPDLVASPASIKADENQPGNNPPVSDYFTPQRAGGNSTSSSQVAELPETRPLKWWPYSLFPPLGVLAATLFPTLQDWSEKSIWNKFISVASAPSIFLLVITLPVVESDTCGDDCGSGGEADVAHDHAPADRSPSVGPFRSTSAQTPAAKSDAAATMHPDNEWYAYRQHQQSVGSRSLTSQTHPTRGDDIVPANHGVPVAPAAAVVGSGSTAAASGNRDIVTAASDGDGSIDGGKSAVSWNRWLVAVQLVTGPLFLVLTVWANMEPDSKIRVLGRLILYALLSSMVLLVLLLLTTSPHVRPRFHYLLCFMGFVISIAWISTIAGEVVGVLKAFGVIVGISEAVLGLTVFAVGNSLGDLVADVTVARLGYPVMALAACFGGPMLNILLGIGFGGLLYPQGRTIELSGTLIVSAISLLITLALLLIVVPLHGWMMTRTIGWGLITLWSVSTAINLIIEVTGVWGDFKTGH